MTKKNNKKTVAEIVTQRFIDALEKDNIPWIKPWEHWTSWSRNTGDDYQGVNIANLSGGEYVTFKQAQEEGIKINKGAKSEIIVKYTNYMKTINKEDLNKAENIARYRVDEIEDLGNGKVKVPARSIRYYNVFNVKECTDAEEKHEHTQEAHEWDPIDKADEIVKGYINASGLKSTTASNQPLYDSAAHRVELGRPEQFMTAEAYYSTAFHELIHSTAKALNRNCSAYHVSKPARAREELVAEIGAAYIMSYLGIENGYSINNSEAYVKSWIKNLKDDPNAILWAAPKAIEAAELILAAQEPEADQKKDAEPEYMTIKNLAEFKRAIEAGREYVITKHFIKPELTGQRRKSSKVQTNAWYSVVPGEPDNPVSKANGGLGYYNQYRKASDWVFNGEEITQNFKDGEPVQTIKVLA